ncbi:hypothetical protein K1719_011676 [Acacia pycnantha]|nr:hypothetical protein K1719_011676 [Acacia pycnantha]
MGNQMSDSGDNNGTAKKFPVGMSFLVVDNDLIFLKELETLLVKCEYQADFDVDPVMSAQSDTRLVMRAVTNGACDYLLKPLRMEELKHIRQHVVQRKKFDKKDQNTHSQVEKANNMAEEGNTSKPRVIWSPERHKKFVAAIYRLGLERAVPGKVLEMMNVEGLTCENVASHLQRYRIYLGKPDLQAKFVATLSGTMQQLSLKNNSDQCKMLSKKRKDQGEDGAEDRIWSLELHKKIVAAIDRLGLENALPKKIHDLMNDEE